jgi:hypothetical protein
MRGRRYIELAWSFNINLQLIQIDSVSRSSFMAMILTGKRYFARLRIVKFNDRSDAGRQLVNANAGMPMPVVYEETGGSLEYYVLALHFPEALGLEEKVKNAGKNGWSL